jgi:hypothetical protein
VEAAAARGVELDEQRAARAVAAGRGQELLIRVTHGGPAELPPEPTEASAELAEP